MRSNELQNVGRRIFGVSKFPLENYVACVTRHPEFVNNASSLLSTSLTMYCSDIRHLICNAFTANFNKCENELLSVTIEQHHCATWYPRLYFGRLAGCFVTCELQLPAMM